MTDYFVLLLSTLCSTVTWFNKQLEEADGREKTPPVPADFETWIRLCNWFVWLSVVADMLGGATWWRRRCQHCSTHRCNEGWNGQDDARCEFHSRPNDTYVHCKAQVHPRFLTNCSAGRISSTDLGLCCKSRDEMLQSCWDWHTDL